MSEYERSYYEIALTNGQVMMVFGVLLTVLFGAFVSGMWVARSSLAGDAPEQVAALQAPPAASSETKERVSVFGNGESPAQQVPEQAASQPAPAPRRAAAPSSGGSATQTTGAPAQSGNQGKERFEPEAPPPSTPSAQAAQRKQEEQRAAAAAEAKRLEEEAKKPRPRPVVDTPQVSDLPVIQVLSSSDEGQASQLVRRLKGKGHRAFISPVQVDGRTMYRVRVGPFSQRDEAETEAGKLKRDFKLDTWITTN